MNDSDSLVPGWKAWIVENKWQAVMGLFGLFLLLVGLASWWKEANSAQNSVEVIEVDGGGGREDAYDGEGVVVDVSGAVERPGVYSLSAQARVGEALEAAGGLKEEADSTWISKNLNLAQGVKDGMKVYVPFSGGLGDEGPYVTDGTDGTRSGTETNGRMVNINEASKEELDSLWGIGEARAKAIIESRPYQNIEEIVSKAAVPQNVFDEIKEEISVF